MQSEVYADLLFMINFSMDFLCLFITSRILHCRLKIFLAFAAAVIGGIYSIAVLFIPWSKTSIIITDLMICASMCAMCFISHGTSLKQYIQSVFVYLACATALGGIMTALFNVLNRLDIPENAGGDNISSWMFLLLAIISGFSAIRSTSFIKKKNDQKTSEAEIIFENKRIIFKGLSDTGNIVKDPSSGKSVIITDLEKTLPLLPEILQNAIKTNNTEYLCSLPLKYSKRIRLIPSQTISGNRLLIGIIPDQILLHTDDGVLDVSAIFAPVSLYDLPLNCNAIIPGNLYK